MAASDSDFTSEFSDLTPEQQAEVLGFMRSLRSRPRGTPGRELLKFVGTIPQDDLAEMQKAIEESCGQVNHDQW